VLESTSAYRPGVPSELDAEVAATARELIEKDGAENIVVLGAVMAGIGHRGLRASSCARRDALRDPAG
jgi:hypothetical protein